MNKLKNNTSSAKPDKASDYSRISILVPKNFHKEIKQCALDEDTTVTDLICKVMKDYLENGH